MSTDPTTAELVHHSEVAPAAATREQVRVLAAVVRDGAEQREHLVALLHLVDTAASLAPRAAERYPDNPELAAVYAAAAWEPVRAGYAKLLDAVSSVAAQ